MLACAPVQAAERDAGDQREQEENAAEQRDQDSRPRRPCTAHGGLLSGRLAFTQGIGFSDGRDDRAGSPTSGAPFPGVRGTLPRRARPVPQGRREAAGAPRTKGWPVDVRGTIAAVMVDEEGAVMARGTSRRSVRGGSLLGALVVLAAAAAALLAPAAAAGRSPAVSHLHPDRRSGGARDRRRDDGLDRQPQGQPRHLRQEPRHRPRVRRLHQQGAAGQPVGDAVRPGRQGPLRGRLGGQAKPPER